MNGSSPRVWGTLDVYQNFFLCLRFIPTCVGNSNHLGTIYPSRAVHPHVCGELSPTSSIYTGDAGSSPRVWGTLSMQYRYALHDRFIPTCVGNSRACPGCRPGRTVHPHVCGELLPMVLVTLYWFGSSPRVWGTLGTLRIDRCALRFIPTCVGNSPEELQQLFARAVHPHVCGELERVRTDRKDTLGSSPRVWGTLTDIGTAKFMDRFIPTCVGNSDLSTFQRRELSVHPHVCGELEPGVYNPSYGVGSSPRVWGTPDSILFNGAVSRFIPTCVGNS